MAKRLTLLTKYYSQSQDVLQKFKIIYPAQSSKTDDVLDALSLALIGAMGIKNGVCSIPSTPMEDAKAIIMQIIGAKPFL